MHRFAILSHTSAAEDGHGMADEASRTPTKAESTSDHGRNSKEFICEIEFTKSRIITLSSCDNLFKERTRNILYKSCGHIEPGYKGEIADGGAAKKNGSVSNEQAGPPKARRFRRISLPHWFHKTSKKSSRGEELRGRWASGSRKRRMGRVNSAPKTFGTETRNADKKATPGDDFQLKADKASLEVKAAKSPEKARATRRISLPAHLTRGNAGLPLVDEESLAAKKAPRKNTMPALKTYADNTDLENLRKSLMQSTGITAEDASTPPKEEAAEKVDENHRHCKRTCSFSAVQEIVSEQSRNDSAEYTNQRRLMFSPQLQRFKKPDMFFIPLPDDGDDHDHDETEKITNVMRRARRIEPSSNQHQEAIQEIMEYQLQSYLRQRVFMPRCSQQWCLDLSQAIKVRVQNLREGFKVVCVVYIGAVRGYGLHAAVESSWSPKDDNFVVASYKNRSLFAIASVLVLKYL